MARPTIDHRGPEFAELGLQVLRGLARLVRTTDRVALYPSSGSEAWEAALVNTLRSGDRILMFETGHFGIEWARVAERLGLEVDLVPGDWRRGIDPAAVEERLSGEKGRSYKAVAVLHNETSTGAVSPIAEIRAAMDRADHPALLLVDTISSLGSLDYRHDEWRVDITVGASQKGLMLPPGLAFLAVSDRALVASKGAGLPRSYWDWDRAFEFGKRGYFPYSPPTNLLYGLREALAMIEEEGLDAVIARHDRHGRATRAALSTWGLENQCAEPGHRAGVVTAVRLAEDHDAEEVRRVALEKYGLSLGVGLGRLRGRVFRIGHLGDFNDLMLSGTLSGVESALRLSGVPVGHGGVDAALASLESYEQVTLP